MLPILQSLSLYMIANSDDGGYDWTRLNEPLLLQPTWNMNVMLGALLGILLAVGMFVLHIGNNHAQTVSVTAFNFT